MSALLRDYWTKLKSFVKVKLKVLLDDVTLGCFDRCEKLQTKKLYTECDVRKKIKKIYMNETRNKTTGDFN